MLRTKLRRFISANPGINIFYLFSQDGFTPLAVALQQGHDKVVATLLEHGAGSKLHLPALHIAAKTNDQKAVSLLLQNKSDINRISKVN